MNNNIYHLALRELWYKLYTEAWNEKIHNIPADLNFTREREARLISQSYSISKEEQEELYKELIKVDLEQFKERVI